MPLLQAMSTDISKFYYQMLHNNHPVKVFYKGKFLYQEDDVNLEKQQ